MSAKGTLLLRVLFVSIISFCLPRVQAQVFWDGGAGTFNWTDADNWSGNTVPATTDSVILDHSLITGNYQVLINTSVNVKYLNVAPSSVDSIRLNITGGSLRVNGTGYNALRVGARGRIHHTGGSMYIEDIANHGMLLDSNAYYYHGVGSGDVNVIQNIEARYNSTFEYYQATSSFFVFPLSVNIDSVVFYHLKFSSGASGGAYGVTPANNWDLIVNGDFMVDNAAFGVIRGDFGQDARCVRLRGDVIITNTTKSTWVDYMATPATSGPVTFGWNVHFEGNSGKQTVHGKVNFLDMVEINNPDGVEIHDAFIVSALNFNAFPNKPGLVLTRGILSTTGNGLIDILIADTASVRGHAAGGAAVSGSHINGVIRRAINGTAGVYDFPVGTSGNYQLLSIKPDGITGTNKLTVDFHTAPIRTIPVPLTENSIDYHSILNGGYWNVVPNVQPAAGTYDIHAYRTGFTNGAGRFAAVTRTDSVSDWGLKGTAAGASAAAGIIAASRTGLDTFCQIGIATTLSEPTDLAIQYKNYPVGTTTQDDTLFLDFVLKNNGPVDLKTGDTVYFSARINNVFLGLDLIRTETPIILTADLNSGDSLEINPGYLVSEAVLQGFPGASTSVEVCVVVWGKGLESVDLTPAFPADPNPDNNITCVVYESVPPENSVENSAPQSAGIAVFPNPAHDQFVVTMPETAIYRIQLTDLTGRSVHISDISGNSAVVPVSGLPGGLYMYTVSGERGGVIAQGRIVIQ